MSHAVTVPRPPFVAGGLRVHQVPLGSDNLGWVAECVRTGEALAVDGPDAGPVLDYCAAAGIRLGGLLNTHTHGDHVGINRDLAGRGLLAGMRVVGPRSVAKDVPGLTEGVDDGDTVLLGDCAARVWRTEGHLNGHISFVFEGVLFCGDTLFTAGCGYLFDGPAETMFRSLMRLASLPPETAVCCGHEYTQDNLRFAWSVEPGNAALLARMRSVWAARARGESTVPGTIEEERATNPFLRPGAPELVERVREQLPEADLSTPAAVFAATRRLKDLKRYRAVSDEALPTSTP